MKEWTHRLGSMRIGIGLLVVVLVAMAAGTIVESMLGTEAALRSVYGAAWFRILLGLFAANIFFSLVSSFPWGRQRIGFVFTHGSMLVILVGALVTKTFKIEGHLALWEGEESAAFASSETSGEPGSAPTLQLPFTVRLESFEIDYYQGTRRPAMFRSRVVVNDATRGLTFPAVIEMNRELSYRGYRLFQSSYQQTQDREQTVLAVSRDPGQPIVFFGYGLLMLGMTTVLVTRIAQRRAAAPQPSLLKPKALRAASVLPILLLAGVVNSIHAQALQDGPTRAAGAPPGTESLSDPTIVNGLSRLPVQHDGRVMPLDTLAREAVVKVTGMGRWHGMDPVTVVLAWATDPHAWAAAPVVRIGSRDLAYRMGLPDGTRYASFGTLVGNRVFLDLIGQARAEQDADRPLRGPLKDASRVEDRLVWMQGFLDGSSLKVLPGADAGAEWSPPRDPSALGELTALLHSPPRTSFYPSPRAIEREMIYNRVRPSRLAWWILLASTVVSILGSYLRRRWLDALALAGLLAGFGVMTWGIVVRWQIAGRIPASNMYESLLFLGWGVALFALIAFVALHNRLVIVNATTMSALAMFLADVLPIDPFIHPMPPVLSGTPWLVIHVPIIMISYSVLALGVLIAHMQIGIEIFAPAKRDLAGRMQDLLYWYIHVGSILLIAGIMTGSIWASSSWGRYWGWDPKEVWSLIAFFAYLAILHGRLDKILGSFGVAAMSIVAFWMILMTYIGVNFVLTAGLHSYGFGGSRVVMWLVLVAALEVLFIGSGVLARSLRQAPSAASA